MDQYPQSPGFKVAGTSQEAAVAIEPKAKTLQRQVLVLLGEEPRTADECAEVMGETVLSVRPRLSELRKLGRIQETSQRRKNKSGRSATVWRLAMVHTQQELFP